MPSARSERWRARTFDPKFVLQPGEGRDARFELTWEPGKEPVGASFELDLAVREIALVTADQYRLGQEHVVHFASLGAGAARSGRCLLSRPLRRWCRLL